MSFLINLQKKKYDLLFLDPPFKEASYINDLKNIFNLKLYKKDHLVIIHRERKSKEKYNDFLKVLFEKNYGRSKILFMCFS